MLTILVPQSHNSVHIIGILHNITRQVFNVDSYIWPFFHLFWGFSKKRAY